MRMKSFGLAAALLFACHAQASPFGEGAYFSVGAGFTTTDLDNQFSGIPGVSVDDTGLAAGFVGGGTFEAGGAVSIGIEAGWSYLGKYTAEGPGGSVDIEAHAIELATLLIATASPSVDLFARVGMARWRYDVDYAGSETGTDPLFGVGALFGSSATRIRIAANFYKVDEVDAAAYTIGAQHSF